MATGPRYLTGVRRVPRATLSPPMKSWGRPSSRPPSMALFSGPGDPPDHAGVRDLDQRSVGRDLELGGGVALPEVPDSPVVDQEERPVGSEEDAHRPGDGAEADGESLVAGNVLTGQIVRVLLAGGGPVGQVGLVCCRAVESEAGELEPERLAWLAEVHELDVVPLFRLTVGGREPEVALAGNQRRAP